MTNTTKTSEIEYCETCGSMTTLGVCRRCNPNTKIVSQINKRANEATITHAEMCKQERVKHLQRGMNFRVGGGYSILLMNTSDDSHYNDKINRDSLTYEGHDINASLGDPKTTDQPETNQDGSPTQNTLFYNAANEYKTNNKIEIVKVYEKIKTNMWIDHGSYKLVDAWKENLDRIIYKFKLESL